MNKQISIIIPIRNEEKYIHECLESIINFDYPKEYLEVIFIDGNSEDMTLEILKKYQKNYNFIKIFNNPKKIVPVSMNIGIKYASGEYIVRLDAHAKYPTNYLTKLLYWSQKLNADNVGAVCITEIKTNTYSAKAIKFVMSDKLGVGNSLFRTGSNEVKQVDTVPFGFYKKEVFTKNGYYDERLIRVQDLEFNKRLIKNGGKIFLVPDVQCRYFPRETFSSFFKNRFLTGKWIILASYFTNDLNSISLRHLIPLFFILSLFISFFISLISNIGFYLLLFIFGSYSGILFLRSLTLKHTYLQSTYNLFAYYILHFSYALGSLDGFISIIRDKIQKNLLKKQS